MTAESQEELAEVSKALHIIIDKHGNPWGPFDNARRAVDWAKEMWPDQKQVELGIGNDDKLGIGWDLWALRHPAKSAVG